MNKICVLILVCASCHPVLSQTALTLDLIGLGPKDTAAVAFSIRKLSSSYTGPALSVISSFDYPDNIKDLGFDASGKLDTTGLKDFCTTCIVTKWYDQSGHQRDAQMLQSHKFPPILRYDSSELGNQKNIMAIDFWIQQGYFQIRSALTTEPFQSFENGFSLFIVAQRRSTLNSGSAMVTKTNANEPSPWDMYDNQLMTLSQTNGQYYQNLITQDFLNTLPDDNLKVYSFSGGPEDSNPEAFLNLENNSFSSKKFQQTPKTYATVSPLMIGSRDDKSTHFDGFINEIIAFPKKYYLETSKLVNSTSTKLIKNQMRYFDVADTIIASETAAVGFSLRTLGQEYDGPALKVRVDSTEYMIGYLETGELDTVKLKKISGTSDAYVTTWYDQSGNGYHAIQQSPSQQPMIVKAGKICREYGKPTIFFDFNPTETPSPKNITYLITPGFSAFNAGFTLFIAGGSKQPIKPFSGLVSKTFGFYPGPWNLSNDQFFVGNPVYSFFPYFYYYGFRVSQLKSPINSPGFHIWSFSAKQGQPMESYVDGNSNILEKVTTGPLYDLGNSIIIGSQGDGKSGFNGTISEIIAIPEQLSGTSNQFKKIQSDMQSYYYTNRSLTQFGLGGRYPAAVAYGLRLLNSEYNGPAIEVSNGQSTATIGFDSLGNLDTLYLKGFCKENCKVISWYDQSGNYRNVSQVNDSLRPMIVQNAEIIRKNGKPSLYFDGTINKQPINLHTAPFIDFQEAFSLFFVGEANEQNGKSSTLISRTKKNIPYPWDVYNSSFLVGENSSTYKVNRLNTAVDSGIFSVWSFMSNQDVVKSYLYDSLNLSSIQSQSWNEYVAESLYIGSRADHFTSLKGYISEVVAFPSYTDNNQEVWNRVTSNMLSEFSNSYDNNCLSFDPALQNYASLYPADAIIPDSAYTEEAWIKLDRFQKNEQYIISGFSNFYIQPITNQLTLIFQSADGAGQLIDPNPLPVNEWTHIAWSYNGADSLKLYVNGDLVNSTNIHNGSLTLRPNGLVQIVLGAGDNGSTGYFSGQIDEVRTWSEARSIEDLNTYLYRSVPTNAKNLIVYYKMNEGIAGGNNTGLVTIKDAVKGREGTIYNFQLQGDKSNWVLSTAPVLN